MRATTREFICGHPLARTTSRHRRVALATVGIVVALLGLPAAPAAAVETPIEVSPLSVDFGGADVGATRVRSVQVTNTSATPFGPINMFGGAPPTAAFNGSQNCQGRTLAGGASCQITYSFSPAAPGPASDTSSFTISQTPSQAEGENFSVALTGVGVARHDRTLSLRLRNHLVAKGGLSVSSDDSAMCVPGMTVEIQRRRDGVWRTVDTQVTGTDGSYRDALPDRVGKYRAVVEKVFLNGGSHVCRAAVSPVKRHKHA